MGRLKCQVHAKQPRRPFHSKDTPIKHKNSFRRVLSKKINVYGPLLELSELEESKVRAAQGSLFDKGLYCSLSHPTSTLALETVAGLEHNTSISYEVSDESCSHAAASTTYTSSLPSPEVFRSGCDGGTPGVRALRSLDFSIEEEPLDFCSEVKNSTLLDVSHAKNIHMQQPLDLSTIKGTSSYSPVRENQSSESKGTIVESKRCSNHFVSDWNFKKISPKAGLPRGATPVQRRNKVRFTSPVSDVITRPPGAVQTCSPGSRGTGEPDRPVRPGRVTARLFRFAGGRDAFFRILRERVRCSRLRVPSFLRDVTRGNPHAEVPSRGVTC